jgi:hypothetical protein
MTLHISEEDFLTISDFGRIPRQRPLATVSNCSTKSSPLFQSHCVKSSDKTVKNREDIFAQHLPVILVIIPEDLRFIFTSKFVDRVSTARMVEAVLIDETRMETISRV